MTEWLERLQEIEEEIRSRLLAGEELQDMGIDEEYISFVEQIERKDISLFNVEDMKKYKYLSQIADFRNRCTFEELGI